MVGISLGRNWWGTTKINRVAPSQASARSEQAITFEGRRIPGRYLMFSWRELIISDNFCMDPSSASTISSNTHKLTRELQFERRSQLRPTRVDIAEPQLPLPTMQTFSTSSALFCRLNSILFFGSGNEKERSDCCSDRNFDWMLKGWCEFDVADSCVECKWPAENARVLSMMMSKDLTLLHLLLLWYNRLKF